MRSDGVSAFRQLNIRKNIVIPISLFIVVLLGVITVIFTDCLEATKQLQRMNTYGAWHVAVYNAEEDTRELLSDNAMVESVGQISVYAEIFDKGDTIVTTAGCMDKTIEDIGNISIIDGHMPVSDKEVAIEASTLTRLGYSYELGQTIVLYIRLLGVEAGPVLRREFILCGVLSNYANLWKHENTILPSVILDNTAFDNNDRVQINVFVKLYDKYAKYASNLSALIQKRFFLNDYTYRFYSDQKTDALNAGFLKATILITGFAIVVLLLNNEMTRIRSDLLTLRILGATRASLFRFMFRGLVLTSVMAVFGGLILGVFIAYIACNIIARSGYEIAFSLIPTHIALFFALSLCGILIVLMFGMIRLFGLSLSGKPDQQAFKPVLKHLRPIRNGNIISRFRNADLKKNALSFTLSVFTALLILISTYGAFKQYCKYSDYKFHQPQDYSYGFIAMYQRPPKPVSKDVINDISYSYGVKEVQTVCASDYNKIELPDGYDKDYSSAVTDMLLGLLADNDINRTSEADVYGALTGISSNLYSVYLPLAGLDKNDYLGPDEVVLLLPNFYFRPDGSLAGMELFVSSSRKPEDLLSEKIVSSQDRVVFYANGEKYEFKIKGIIHDFGDKLPFSYYMSRPYSIICSTETYERILGSNDYVYALVYGDEDALGYQTDVELSKVKSSLGFQNNRLEREKMLNELYTQFILALILSFAGMLMVILARIGIQSVAGRYELFRKKVLWQLGMPKEEIRVKQRFYAVKESILSGVLAFALSLIWLYTCLRIEYVDVVYQADSVWEEQSIIFKTFLDSTHWLFLILVSFVVTLLNTVLLTFKKRYDSVRT